jgi:hypothetical protein
MGMAVLAATARLIGTSGLLCREKITRCPVSMAQLMRGEDPRGEERAEHADDVDRVQLGGVPGNLPGDLAQQRRHLEQPAGRLAQVGLVDGPAGGRAQARVGALQAQGQLGG